MARVTPKTSSKSKQQLLVFLLLYAILLLLGGIFAHEPHAKGAIYSSVASGLLVLVGWWLVLQDKKHALLFNLGCVGSLLLFFLYRLSVLKKLYPPGFLTLVSLLLILKIWQSLRKTTAS